MENSLVCKFCYFVNNKFHAIEKKKFKIKVNLPGNTSQKS